MNLRRMVFVTFLPMVLTAQVTREVAPVHSWPAPLYWQPNEIETHAAASWAAAQPDAAGLTPQAQSPANSLVFVAMTPCRVLDTRTGQGFSGAFGPPSLGGGTSRTFPVQSSPNCTIPSVAKAYSFNVTVIPPGFLGFITVYPTGQARPNASTMNDLTGLVLANAAIVAAGTSGSVDVFANNNTDLIIDINGYYASQSGITLAPGTLGAPSLSFTGDPLTGMFSSAAGAIDFSTGGTTRMTLRPDGDVDIPGNIRKNGTLFLHNGTGGANIGLGLNALASNAAGPNTALGHAALQNNTTGSLNTATGYQALIGNIGGSYNTANGYGALEGNTTGNMNTAIGYRANYTNTIGSGNISIGDGAGHFNITGNSNIMIGNNGSGADDSTTRIGDVQTRTFIAGIRNVTMGQANALSVVIDSNGQLGTVSSSRRYKEDIQDMADSSSDLLRLRPVTFRYKKPYEDGSKPLDYGLIAEEVAEVYPDLVARNKDGQIETVQYQKLTPMLLNEVQRLNHATETQFHQQAETILLLQDQNRERMARLAALSSKVPTLATSGQ
jgi:hypothetical protein